MRNNRQINNILTLNPRLLPGIIVLFLSFFCFSNGFAQRKQINMKFLTVDGVVDSLPCLNTTARDVEFKVLVQRNVFADAESDKDCSLDYFIWNFPNEGWEINKVANGWKSGIPSENQYDTLYLNLLTRQVGTRDAAIAGIITAYYVDDVDDPSDTSGVLSQYISVLPGKAYGASLGATPPDTILISGSGAACEGEVLNFYIPFKSQRDTIAALSSFYGQMKYKALVYEIGDILPSLEYEKSGKDTLFNYPLLRDNVERIEVYRYFCGDYRDVSSKSLYLDIVKNPPLDTMEGSNQNKIYRITLLEAPGGSSTGADTMLWDNQLLNESTPTCVNYGRVESNGPDRFGLTAYAESYSGESDYSHGYLFFQVGDTLNPHVKYIWEYDTSLLQRIYADEITYFANRVRPYINGVDFGTKSPSRQDSTWRIMFRVREKPADSAKREIRVSVQAVATCCMHNGIYFQNKRVYYDLLEKPMDTVKPFNDFRFVLDPMEGTSSCCEVPIKFKMLPNAPYDYDILRDTYNITSYKITPQAPPYFSSWEVTLPVPLSETADFTIKLGSWGNGTDLHATARLWISARNNCFVKITNPFSIMDSIKMMRPPFAPLIYDEMGTLLKPSGSSKADTLFVCRERPRDMDGNDIYENGERKEGVTLKAVNAGDSLVRSPLANAPSYFPSQIYHGVKPGSYIPDFLSILSNIEGTAGNQTTSIISLNNKSKPDYGRVDTICIFAQNKCGIGDSAVIYIRVTDTITLESEIYERFFDEDLSDYEWKPNAMDTTPCEGINMMFRTRNVTDGGERSLKLLFLADSTWKIGSQQIGQSETDPFTYCTIKPGKDSSYVAIKTFNVCGPSRTDSIGIYNPIPYIRPRWKEVYDEVCQDSVYAYRFDTIQSSLKYYIRFPDDWVITSNILNSNIDPPIGRLDSITKLEVENYGIALLSWKTRVGQSSGFVEVAGLHEYCDVIKYRDLAWDSLKVQTYIEPSEPILVYKPGDTVCARTEAWFVVKPALIDSAENQKNKYDWHFPNSTWQILNSSANRDSVYVRIGNRNEETDTISVVPSNVNCGERQGPALKITLCVWDTIVYERELVLDAMMGDLPFGLKPCQGDSIALYIDKPYLADSVQWSWGGIKGSLGQTIPNNPYTTPIFGKWIFADTAVLPDTFFVATPKPTDLEQDRRTPLYLQVKIRNICGWSSSPEISLVAADVIDPNLSIDFINFDSVLCENAEGFYKTDSVEAADRYIWFFPWAPYRDTVVENCSRTMIPRDTGVVSVVAMNNCSHSDTSQRLRIREIKRAPNVPIPVNFALSMSDEFGDPDVILKDTLCKRRDYGWRILKNPADSNLNLDFVWMKIAGDTASNFFDIVDDDTVNIRGVLGFEKRESTLVGVAGLRRSDGCTVPGDTLKILIRTVDTMRLESLGKILISDPTACYGDLISISIEKDSAVAYRWYLPDTTYKIIGSFLDIQKPTVQIQVGKNPGPFSVSTVTDINGVNYTPTYCPYTNTARIYSDSIKPPLAPVMEGFEIFPDSVCENAIATFKVKAKTGGEYTSPEIYRWTFPQGWLSGGKSDTVTKSNEIGIQAGAQAGLVKVAGIDSCGGQFPNEGEAIDSSIFVFVRPNIDVIGDKSPCPNETYTYELKPTDHHVIFNYKITPLQSSIIIIDNNPLIDITFNGTGVNFEFRNISHSQCPNLTRADYDLPISIASNVQLRLRKDGPDTVCQNQQYLFRAWENNNNAELFFWTVPQEWAADTILKGEKNDTLLVTFNNLINSNSKLGIISVNARTKCFFDEANALTHPVLIDTVGLPSVVFDAKTGQKFSQKPCEGDTLILYLEKNPRYDTLFWSWNGTQVIPADLEIANGWRFLDTTMFPDTLSLIVPNGETNTLNISVSVRNQCGIIKEHPFELSPSTLITQKYNFSVTENIVCLGEPYHFEIAEVPNADYYIWDFSWKDNDTIYGRNWNEFIPELGKLFVLPVNGCGPGLNSDTVSIDQILSRPKVVVPVNFALHDRGQFGTIKSVKDTFCMRSDVELIVEKNSQDAFDVDYHWFYMSGDSISPTVGTDANFIIAADTKNHQKTEKKTKVGVVAVRDGCHAHGDTLIIDLVFVDTIPLAYLGAMIVDPLPSATGLYCPGDTLDVTLTYPNIAANKWFVSNDTWTVLTDSLATPVRILVGREDATVGVVTLTDKEQRFCHYQSSPKLSDSLKVYTSPILDGFISIPDTVCSQETVSLEVELNAQSFADSYLWEITLYRKHDTLVLPPEVTLVNKYDFLADEEYRINVKAYAIDSSCSRPVRSLPIEGDIIVLNEPSFSIVGDTLPCRDSSILYVLVPSDQYVTWHYDDAGKDPGVVTNPSSGDNIDSIYVDFFGEFVLLNITNIQHSRCLNFPQANDISIRIKSDTTPTIPFVIDGPDFVCMGAEAEFIAKKDSDVKFDVSYDWEIHYFSKQAAIEPWDEPVPGQTIFGTDNDTLRVTAAYYDNLQTYVDTLFVYAKGSCGTSKIPQVFPIKLGNEPVFNIPMYRSGADTICQDSLIKVWVDTTGYSDLKIQWRYLDNRFVAGDTIEIPSVQANSTQFPGQNILTVSASFFQQNACGYSKPQSIEVTVFNQPIKPTPVQYPFPCKDEAFELTIPFDKWTDSIYWNVSDPSITYTLHNHNGIVYDSMHIEDVFHTPFKVATKSVNRCGFRFDTITLNPVSALDPITVADITDFDNLRYCYKDTLESYLTIPDNHIESRPTYHWILPDDWTLVKDTSVFDDSIHKIWFIPGEDPGYIEVFAFGCGGYTDTVSTDLKTPVVIRMEALGESEFGVYPQQDFMVYLNAISINNIDQASSSFDLTWTPQGRFKNLITNKDTAYVSTLYKPVEKFVLKVVENDPALPYGCRWEDTVTVFVGNSYTPFINHWDSVCTGSMMTMEVVHVGGEISTPKRQSWYRLINDQWDLIDDQQTVLQVPIFDTVMHFMLIAENDLYTTPGVSTTYTVSDTFWFKIKEVNQIAAEILTVHHIETGEVLNLGQDSVKIGERIRMRGRGDGRAYNFPYIYEWSARTDEYDGDDYYGRIDTTFASSRLILHPKTFIFTVVDSTAEGCIDRDSVRIALKFEGGKDPVDFGTIPGGFTPRNEDGINDIFMKGVDEIVIMNRWGVILYEAKDKKGWNGRDKNNQMVNAGDYFYIITIYEYPEGNTNQSQTPVEHTKTGVVTVF